MRKISLWSGMVIATAVLMAGTALGAAQLTLSCDTACDKLTIGDGTTGSTLSVGDNTLDVGAGGIAVQANGTLTSGAGIIQCAGDWSNSGTFNAGTGTVILDGTAQSMTGSNATNNLTAGNSGIKTIDMGVGGTTISNTGEITGDAQVRLTAIAVAHDKAYDGTTTATADLDLQNIFTAYDVSATYSAAVFDGENVGNDINVVITDISLSGNDSGKFSLSSTTASAKADINPENLLVTATAGSKEYGTTLNDGTGYTAFTSNGLAGSETIGSVSVAYSGGNEASDTVGTYSDVIGISSATGGTFTSSNYSITYSAGDLTVTEKALTITADNTSKVQGTTLTFAGTEFTDSGLVNGDSITSVTLTSTGAAADASPGTYDIEASNAQGTGLANYDITYVNGTLTVKVALTMAKDPDAGGTTVPASGTKTILDAGATQDITGTSTSGYAFVNWTADPAENAAFGDASDPATTLTLTGSATVTANFVPTYTVTYDGNGNTGGTAPTDAKAYEAGDTVTVPEPGTMEKSGYGFKEWNTEEGGGGSAYDPGDTFNMPAADRTLYALWSACTAVIDPENPQHGPDATNNLTMDVTIPERCPWTAASNAEWIILTGEASGTGNGAVTYRITENGYPNQPRTGTISIADKTCTVVQGSFDSHFIDGPAAGWEMQIERSEGGPYILYMNSQDPGGTPPPSTDFPWGIMDFKVVNVPVGGTVRIAFTMTGSIPVGSTFYKFDEETGAYTPYANVGGLNDGDNTFVLILTDGGEGDQDGIANGETVDPGGIGARRTGPAVASVPTLSEWGMILLMVLSMGLALWKLRHRVF